MLVQTPGEVPPAFKAKRDKVMREAKINALFTANDFMEVEDEACIPEDFADLTINDTQHEGQANTIETFCTDATPEGNNSEKTIALDQLGNLRANLLGVFVKNLPWRHFGRLA